MPLEVITAFVANFLLGTISWWLEAGRPYSAKQVAGWFAGFMLRGYLHYLNPDPLALQPE